MKTDVKLDRRQVRSREAIREAFKELLQEKDLSQITVTEIARRADRDRKTFYLHYGSIDDLIDELLQEECELAVSRLEEILIRSESGLNVEEIYKTMGTALLSDFNRRSGIIKHVDLGDLMARIRPMIARKFAENDTLGLSQALGEHLELFVAYFSAGLLNLFRQWMELESELPIERLSELAMATVSGGVAALVKAAEEMQVSAA
ncbi:MAG: TetR/AcrR family transcriptional regulator [Coriobacteriales bacterium]